MTKRFLVTKQVVHVQSMTLAITFKLYTGAYPGIFVRGGPTSEKFWQAKKKRGGWVGEGGGRGLHYLFSIGMVEI